MEPLSVRLSSYEVRAMLVLLNNAKQKCDDADVLTRSEIRIETIVLSEFHARWWKITAALALKPKAAKDPIYKIPVSVARIIHYRLQHTSFSEIHQWLLDHLDRALLNRGLRPAQPKKII